MLIQPWRAFLTSPSPARVQVEGLDGVFGTHTTGTAWSALPSSQSAGSSKLACGHARSFKDPRRARRPAACSCATAATEPAAPRRPRTAALSYHRRRAPSIRAPCGRSRGRGRHGWLQLGGPAPGPEIGRWAAIERELGFRPQTARGLGIVSPSEAGSALATSVPFRDEVADARRRAVLRTQLACPGDESVDDRSSLL